MEIYNKKKKAITKKGNNYRNNCFPFRTLSEVRTLDPLIKSQLLYQLS